MLPKWMPCILKALDNSRKDLSKHHNIILFIVKFITNCEHAFRPFAKHWFPILINCLRDLREMNYVVTDVVSKLTIVIFFVKLWLMFLNSMYCIRY